MSQMTPSKHDAQMQTNGWNKCHGIPAELGPVFAKGLTNAYPEHRVIKAHGRPEARYATDAEFDAACRAIAAQFA